MPCYLRGQQGYQGQSLLCPFLWASCLTMNTWCSFFQTEKLSLVVSKLPWALPSSSSNVRTTVDLQPDCLPLGRLGNCHICICLARPFSSKELWAAGWPPACPVGVSFLCPGWLLYIGITLVRVRTSFVQFSVLTAHSQIMEEL